MTVVTLANAKQFECPLGSSILDAAKLNGLALEHSCRTGRCGVCKTSLVSGDTRPIKSEESLTDAEKAAGFILTCARTAVTDVSIAAEDLGRLGSLTIYTLPCRINSLEYLTSDVLRVTLRLPPNHKFEFVAGQYVDIIANNGLRRSYSIASSPSVRDTFELHIRQVEQGEMSEYWFSRAKPNDLLRLEGPLGTFCLREKPYKTPILLATGTGIAPIKSMLDDLETQARCGSQLHLFWGGRREQDLYWQPNYTNNTVHFYPVLSRAYDAWQGCKGYVQDAVIAGKFDLTTCVVYACGSPTMIAAAKQLLCAHGLESNDFYADAFVSSKRA